ncbi:MAG: sigma-70 family RNA polymerase sigma factor [Ruminococcus sp.]|nr:sigma-70 family RNA polymerase sigma factor [Ruminococcus sp.]MCM1480472.1 sigma-70 family RNA polymerase sigma factor [Muribaculaceae bacterium]
MQKRLNSQFLGDAEFTADKRISRLVGDAAGSNSARHSLILKVLRNVVENEISPRQRQVIILYYFQKMNISEIACELGVNKSTVSRTVSRGRRNIMERLKYFV